ncbi:MAG: ABC transporter permease [Phycisphaerae bacterium]
MLRYVLLRLLHAALTVFGVMIVTFMLFRLVAGDISAAHLSDRATETDRVEWLHRHGYDRPLWVNIHRRFQLKDTTEGDWSFHVDDAPNSSAIDRLGLIPADSRPGVRLGTYVLRLSRDTPLDRLLTELPEEPEEVTNPFDAEEAAIRITTADGTDFTVDVTGVQTCGELIDRINSAEKNLREDGSPRAVAGISDWSAADLFDSQFFRHLYTSVTFQGRSLQTGQELTEIIGDRAPASLALMIPATAIGWTLSMIIACFVAYYRGTAIDKAGVFLSVLGMCIPFLAYMIYAQWAMFEIPALRDHAYGLKHRVDIYAPVAIMVVAGLGTNVRFYRTVILDETNRDYVRTALAKGVPLPGVLFRHVLRNAMLPILTQLVLALPFLIMGSLLVETFFGIPGLGDLMITSINARDEPIVNGMVFLSAVLYTVGVLVTDLSYALFDPRVRLR